MTVSEPDDILRSTRWCRRTGSVPTGTTGRDTPLIIYTFADDRTYRVEQFVDHDPGGLQSRTIERRAGLSANGVWKVEGEKASLSSDGRTWRPIDLLPASRIRIDGEEYTPCGGLAPGSPLLR